MSQTIFNERMRRILFEMSQTNFDDRMRRINELIGMQMVVTDVIHLKYGINDPYHYIEKIRGMVPPGELGELVRQLRSIVSEKMSLLKKGLEQ
jgi:hypothetical protein